MFEIKRFMADEPSQYRIVGLLMVKPEIDSFTGSPSISMFCKLGDFTNPVKFMDYFIEAQPSLTTSCLRTN
ncbi:hypothetical protein J2Z37_001962 [Ammoniphilus resinae]|uniref:Uncharacterized protein n=1 Tax=Ammoniphilus resinae TaxID=861532 RepID=A0ABS4GNW0_9BACL|nr:hypothetical protein [Ammoniphilus resinae]